MHDPNLILDNARRLLEDAKLLFSNERFKSAISIAILAAEELGKLLILSMPRDLRPGDHAKMLSDHRLKQCAFAVMVLFQMADKLEEETLRVMGLPNTAEGRAEFRKYTRQLSEQSREALEEIGIKHDEFSPEFACWFTNTYLELFGSQDGLADSVGQVGVGLANKLKKSGFYVDASTAATDPAAGESDEEHARRWILAVEQTLGSNVMKVVMAALTANPNAVSEDPSSGTD